MNYEKQISEALTGLHSTMVLKSAKLDHRISNLEQPTMTNVLNIGERLYEEVKDFKEGKNSSARLTVTPYEVKTAIIGAGTQNDPLGNAYKPQLPGNRARLFVRDLMSPAPTKEAAVEYPKATTTNNAAAQNRENTAFAESAATFDLTYDPVQTIGHFVPVSKNILDDSSILNTFLGTKLLYDLRVKEEAQILNGISANSELNGILTGTNYTAFNRILSPDTDNAKQRARRAITQLELVDFTCTGLVLHPVDWESIGLLMDIEPSSNVLYGVPVVSTSNIASGSFLAGDFTRACALFDREDASIDIARHHGTNFQKGMITMLASERVVLSIADPLGLVSGSF